MHQVLPPFGSYILHRASHLGTLDEPREGWKDMMLEPSPKIGVWWMDPEDGRTSRVHA